MITIALLMTLVMSGPDATAGAALPADDNILPNPGLEEAFPKKGVREGILAPAEEAAEGLPANWEPLIIGAPARFSVDKTTVRGGRRAIRIEAAEITRSYLRSRGIPVVPGETLEISAWVKAKDVPAGKGTVIVIAEFSQGSAKGEVSKVGTASTSEDWQPISGRAMVPASCDTLYVRMGFSYSMGTTWWDDAQVRALAPLVARADLVESRLFPAGQAVPIAILNRDRRAGRMQVTVSLDGKPFTKTVDLTGEPVQRVDVPASIARRGKLQLGLQLADATSGREIWSAKPIVVTVPPLLALSPPIPTHWVVEDGPPRIQIDLELALEKAAQAEPPVKISILDKASMVVFEEDVTGQAKPSGTVTIDFQPPPLPPGDYRIVATIANDSGKPITAEQTWSIIPRNAASVRLNKDGFPERNGKAIFPIGMFNNEGRLAEGAEAGFNIVHFYNSARVFIGRKPDDQRLADAMNRCHAAGMNVLLMVPQSFVQVHGSAEADWDGFVRRIRMFRNHPALLAWDEEEGLARGDMKIETLQRIRRILREEDPHHPFMVGDARDVIGRITDRADMFPLSEMDMGMWWWYPFPLKPGAGDALAGEQAAGNLLLDPPEFLTGRRHDKPIWIGIQAYKKPTPDGRYPTPGEFRAQAYLGIIHGARGLMWYGASVTGGTFLNPKEAHWDDLKGVAGELRDLSPVLPGTTAPPPAFTPADAPICVAIKQAGSRRVLMAVNRGPSVCNVSFAVPDLAAGPVRVLAEDRVVTAGPGRLADRFEPYSTHVYELMSEPW